MSPSANFLPSDRVVSVPLKLRLPLCAALLGVCLFFAAAAAQENFEIHVYESETVAPGTMMIELHSNMAVKGKTDKTEGVLPTQHALHETLEITYGFTSWFETAFYILTSIQPEMGWQWVGDHIHLRVRVPESWDWPVGVSISSEIGYQRRKFSTDIWTVEIRPIVDKKMGRWYLAFNPVLGRSLKGESVKRGFEFQPCFKISYDITPKITGGIEYYGSFGPITGFDPLKKQKHQLFPVVDLNLGSSWEFNFGVGMGLTSSTDRLIVKLILGRRF